MCFPIPYLIDIQTQKLYGKMFTLQLFVSQLLGVTCSVLSLYQVKLMPETYDVIVTDIKQSNLTTPVPITPLATVSSSSSSNGRSTIQSGGSGSNKKGSPRVSRYVREDLSINSTSYANALFLSF